MIAASRKRAAVIPQIARSLGVALFELESPTRYVEPCLDTVIAHASNAAHNPSPIAERSRVNRRDRGERRESEMRKSGIAKRRLGADDLEGVEVLPDPPDA